MALADLLTMTDVTIYRDTITEDGMGGVSATTSSTILPRAVIYREGSASRISGDYIMLMGKHTKMSSHILICEPTAYSFTSADKRVTQGSQSFEIVDAPYDVMGYNEVMMVGLRELV